jgi:hypothetical protein
MPPMPTPYVTPQMVMNAPTGVPWDIVPKPQSDGTAAQLAEVYNILWRASGQADSFCNQPLRSTLSVEEAQGPDYRMTVDPSGVARVMLSRWPVTQVLAGRVSPRAAIPRSWSSIPVTAIVPEEPPMTLLSPVVEGPAGAGGQAVLIAPGYVSWAAGRNGYTAEITYLNGWPHAGVTARVAQGASTISVDDVTGMAGTTCFFYDGASTETVTVQSAVATAPVTLPAGGTAQAGSGTLTLAAPVQYPHSKGTVVSALPQDIAWAVILYAAAQVLSEGATAVAIPDIAGSLTSGGKGAEDLKIEAEVILAPYKRVI